MSEERDANKPSQEKKQVGEEVPPKIHNHHSIDAILGRKQVNRPSHKPVIPKDASEDDEDHISDAELSSSEAKSGLQ